MKRLIPKPVPIDLASSSNLSDYFFLTTIFGMGLLISIFAFVVTVHYQHEDAVQKFSFNAGQLHSLIAAKAVRHELELEVLTKFIATNRSVSSAKQLRWLKTRVADTQFSCVSLLRVDPKTGTLWQEKELKKTVDCGRLEPRTSVIETSSINAAVQNHFSINKIMKIDDTNQTYLSVSLPSIALLPKLPDSMKMNVEMSLKPREDQSEFYSTKQLSILGQNLNVSYRPIEDTYDISIGWAWVVLAAGIVITLLVGGIVFSLITRNIAVQKEVDSKTQDLLEATNQAIAANQTKSRFLANVSHEVRTPLNLILGMAEVLSETDTTAEQKNYIEAFRRAGNHLLEIVNDVLDVASIEAGETSYEAHEMSLLDLVESVSDFVAVACRIKKLTFNFDIEPGIPDRVFGDSKRLRQVLINLINNSLKYTDHGGITLRVMSRGASDGFSEIAFEIQDTGIGIPKTEIDKIFGAFYQVDSTSTRSHSGVGLGLSIVKTYVDYLKGSIDVESEVGVGSKFTVTLKLKASGESTWTGEMKRPSRLEPAQKVFLVSPNTVQASFIRNALMELGYEVSVVESGRSALRQLKRSKKEYSRFIIDLVGKDLGGLELIREAKFTARELEHTVALCPIVHRASDPDDLKALGIKHINYAPVKIRKLVASLNQGEVAKAPVEVVEPRPTSALKISEGLRLLIAEDDEDNQFLLQTYLGALNIEVSFANDGKEALERYKTVAPQFDLLITDIQMPEMDGFELIHEVRSFERNKKLEPVPIVALTADAQREQVEKVRSLGGNDYITKPISKSQLLGLITKYTPVGEAS